MNIIAAVSENWGIGKNNDLLFHIPEDMKFFRRMTKDKTVILGRKNLESFPGGKPLKGRRHLLLTNNHAYSAEGVEVYHSIQDVLAETGQLAPDDVWVIGGGMIYEQFLPYCDKDTFFYDVFYYVAGINEDYSGHDIGCDAFEITQTLPWGYDKEQHSGNPSYSVAFIPLMDKNTGQKSNDRLMLEMAWNKCLPYVDANDPGLYDVDLSMWIYTEQGQYLPLHQNGKKSAIGIFKPDGVHVYMVAGVDTLRKADDSLELDMVYGGLIQDVGYGLFLIVFGIE